MQQTRSAVWRAKPMSCVEISIVIPDSASSRITVSADPSHPNGL
jgi:hypothetical protein